MHFFLILICSAVSSSVVGIDVGTDVIRVVYPNLTGKLSILPSPESRTYFPTIFHIDSHGSPINVEDLGSYDYSWRSTSDVPADTKNTLTNVGNFIGRFHTASMDRLIKSRHLSHIVTSSINSSISLRGISPQTVYFLAFDRLHSSLITLSRSVQYSILCVPKFWTSNQREAILIPANAAGLQSVAIDSSVCAASYYSRKYPLQSGKRRVLFIDIGASSTQFSLFDISSEKTIISHELYYSWSDELGGRDFDIVIADLICQQIQIPDDSDSDQILIHEAEQAKIRLGSENEVSGTLFGNSYVLSRKAVESSASMILSSFTHMLIGVSRFCPIDDIKQVFVYGCGSLFFPIKSIILSTFPPKLVVFPSNPENVVSAGGTGIGTGKFVFDSLSIYQIAITRGNDIRNFDGEIPFKNGTVSLEIVSPRIPCGCSPVIETAVVNSSSYVAYDNSKILHFRNANVIQGFPMNESNPQNAFIIYQRMMNQSRKESLKKSLGHDLKFYSEELEESEQLDEVLSSEERPYLESLVRETKQAFEERFDELSANELVDMQKKLEKAMEQPFGRRKNLANLNEHIEQFHRAVQKIERGLEHSKETILKNMQPNFVEMLLLPIISSKAWLKGKIARQSALLPYQDPVLLVSEIDEKLATLSKFYNNYTIKT